MKHGKKLVKEPTTTHKAPHKPKIGSSYAEALRANEPSHIFKEERRGFLFQVGEKDLIKFQKSFVEFGEKLGYSYKMQELFQ